MDSSTLTVLYDGECPFCTRTASILRRLDHRRRLRLLPLRDASLPDQPTLEELIDSLHVVDAHGRWWAGGDAVIEICRRIPSLRPMVWLARLPLARRVIDLAYRLVADNRTLISRLLRLQARARETNRR